MACRILIGILIFCIVISLSSACQSMNGISKKAILLGLDKNPIPNPNPKASSKLNKVTENTDTGNSVENASKSSLLPPPSSTSSLSTVSFPQADKNKQNFNSLLKNYNKTYIAQILSQPQAKNVLLNPKQRHPDLNNMNYEELKRTLEALEEIHNNNNNSHSNSEMGYTGYRSEPGQPRHLNHAPGTGNGKWDRSMPQWFYPRQVPQNLSHPIKIQIQSLTKSSEYIGFKFINISEIELSDNDTVNTSSFLDESVELVEEEDQDSLSLRLFNFTVDPLLKGNPNDPPEEQKAAELNLLPSGAVGGGNSAEDIFDPEEDKKVNIDWGGDCGVADWKACYNITTMGLPTIVDKQAPYDRKKNKMTQLDCFDTMEAKYFPWLCLRNGWTVNRCHILCMSKCNRLLLYTRKWEFYVLHEGACKTK